MLVSLARHITVQEAEVQRQLLASRVYQSPRPHLHYLLLAINNFDRHIRFHHALVP